MTNQIKLYESKHNENHEVKTHFHHSFQILYSLDGSGICVLNGQKHQLKQDNIVIISPLTSHSIEAKSRMTILVLEFDDKSLSEEVRTQLLEKAFASSAVRELDMFSSSELRQLLRKMLYEQAHGDGIKEMVKKIHIAEMLCMLIRSSQQVNITDKNVLRAQWLKDYIDTRYFDIEGAEDLSNRMNMSKRYIQSIFKESFDKTPMQYLTEVRLSVVKNLLVETEKDIVSICFEVGFESLSTFYRIFKKYIGVPPNVYRTTQFTEEN